MITPYDIEVKEFSKTLRGFHPEEVDDFLGEIYLTLQQLIQENTQLKEKAEQLAKEVETYRSSEKSVVNTIESAKVLMNDISESAERRAEIIIKNAQMDAEAIQRDAKDSVARMTEEGERLKQRVNRYREKYRQLLEDELSQLDGSSEELFAELEKEFMPASMDDTAVKYHTQQQSQAQVQPQVKQQKPVSVPVQQEVKPAPASRSTMVIDEKSIEAILKETYGVDDKEPVKVVNRKDLARTKIFNQDM